jgi:hypothetical protein
MDTSESAIHRVSSTSILKEKRLSITPTNIADTPRPSIKKVPINISLVIKKIPKTTQCHQSRFVVKYSSIM